MGRKLALLRLLADIQMVVGAGMIAALFLGGFPGGLIPGFIWFIVKTLAVVFILAWVMVRKTSIGLFIESVGVNAKSSYYSGISEKNVKLIAYTFCGFCAAIAGLILSSYVHSADGNNNGLNYELDAILAVVIGGTLMTGGRFSLFASIVGALIIWTFTITMYTFGVPANALLAGRAVLVLVVILLYSAYARRLMNRLFERKGPQHGATS